MNFIRRGPAPGPPVSAGPIDFAKWCCTVIDMEAAKRVEFKFQLSGPDLERLVLVGGDLEYLIDGVPADRLLSHTEVRLCAGVLRRLLVDDELGRLWRSVDPPADIRPTVEVTDIDTPLSKWPEQWVRYAWAGGAVAGSHAHYLGLVFGLVPKAEHEEYGSPEAFLKANPMPMTADKRRMTIDRWLSSTSVAIQTNELGLVRISRAAVLKYIANRKGGVHFDPGRKLNLKVPRKWRKEAESHLLDHGLVRVGHLSGPEYEVASMVHAIRSTDWANEIVRSAQELAPADFDGDPSELKFWTFAKEADGTGWATQMFHPLIEGLDKSALGEDFSAADRRAGP